MLPVVNRCPVPKEIKRVKEKTNKQNIGTLPTYKKKRKVVEKKTENKSVCK